MLGETTTPDLYDIEDDLESLVRYFEQVEQELYEKSGFPVQLVQTETARRASVSLFRIREAERERQRTISRRDPDETAIAFIQLAAAFLNERKLDWSDLEESLFLPSGAFDRLSDEAEQLTQ